MRIRLVIPDVRIVGYQPPLIGDSLAVGLCDLAADCVVGAEAAVEKQTRPHDVVFVMGNTQWQGEAAEAWRVDADAWAGYLIPVGMAGKPLTDPLPLGALAAATAAAAEPYRMALVRVAAATGCRVTVPELLIPQQEVSLRLAAPATPSSGFQIGALDLVSGGALSTALLHVLLRIDGLQAAMRVWEPQMAEGSNLNRYLLLRRSMLPIPKIEMLERWAHGGIVVKGFRDLVDAEVIGNIQPWAPWVFVGADRVEARWLVQSTWPDHLVVAGTEGFMAMASEHDRHRPCVGCLHPAANPPGQDVATISFVSYLGGLLAAARLLRWVVVGAAPDAEQMTEAYADRLDTQTGYRLGPVTRNPMCPVRCGRVNA
jgi:hypothetical protein